MNRDNILAVRLTDEERRAAEALAAHEKLPLSTLVRRSLLLQVEAEDICPPAHAAKSAAVSGGSVASEVYSA